MREVHPHMSVEQDLPLHLVRPNPKQPRKLFDEAELRALAESIAKQGLLQPITVRPHDGWWEIVCGERRFRAHALLGLTTVRARVVVMTDEEMADAAIVENLQRRDITPLEEAHAFQARLDTGLTVEQLAQRLGLKQPWRITERTALLKLVPEYRDALQRGILTPSQGFELSRHPPHHQRELFDAIGAGQCKSFAELRAVSQGLINRRAQTDLFVLEAAPREPSQAERRTERLIGALSKLLRATSKDNEPVLHIPPGRAEHFAAELDVIERHVRRLRLTLVTATAAKRRAG